MAGSIPASRIMQLMQHQIRARDIGRERKRYGFYFECGTGKTIAALAICAERPIPTVVCCPKAIIDNAWLADARYFPGLRVVSGRCGGKADRRSLILSRSWDIIVGNYEWLKVHVKDLIAAGVKRVILDESSAMKNPRAQTTAACLELARACDECYLLSGTPAPNGQHEYWAQLRAIVPALVDPSYWRWVNRYMYPIKKSFNGREFVSGWKMIESRRAEFNKLLADNCWSLSKEDAVDLPEKMDVFREIELSDDELAAYVGILTNLQAEWDGRTIDFGVQSRLMKLRQVTGGIINDEGRRHEVGTAKLDALVEVLEEIGDKPVVIWAEFTADIDRIVARLGSGGRAMAIDGRTPDAARSQGIKAFGSSLQYLVCHPRAVGHGITLTQSSYAIYYSLGFSYETYAQSRDRIHRVGQKHPCTYIHLLASRTCDRRILDALQGKASMNDAMKAVLSNGVEHHGRMETQSAGANRMGIVHAGQPG